MSFSESRTEYQFVLNIDNGTSINTGSFTLTSQCGFDDATSLAVLEALNGVSWPAGIKAPFTVTRLDVVDTTYTPDLTTTPPSFT